MSFVHLHAHTEYSLLDGLNKIQDYVSCVKKLNMKAAAITDHGSMFGVIHFYKECKKQGIKPILGCEVYVSPTSRFNKSSKQNKYFHLILLAENNIGYSNLIKIVSRGYTEGFYYKPRIDKDLLKEYKEGIICLSGCLAGEIPKSILNDNYDDAKKICKEYIDILGKDNFFLEIQDHGDDKQKFVNQEILNLSKELNIDVVATNDIHYTYKEDAEPHDVLLCIQTNSKIDDKNRLKFDTDMCYVKSEEEMRELFPYLPEAIDNTVKIADRCNVEIKFDEKKLPKFKLDEDIQAKQYLYNLCLSGLKKRYKDYEGLIDRLDYEISVIDKMGFVDYFLIVWDFVNYAKTEGIPVGPGRGSAAGSIVAYTLGITEIDPIKYNLIFERFLNPNRLTMPDIDIDFCFERRQEVINYVIKKYGKDCVSQIITFGSMLARAVVRDVARVKNYPYEIGDKIAKKIPTTIGFSHVKVNIDLALAKNPELKELYDNDKVAKEIIDVSKKLEGVPRHISRHAAGILIADKSIENYVPLALVGNNDIVEQFDMETLEQLGLLKMDFLGLRTLTVIKNTISLVKQQYGIDIDINKIPMDDKKVYDMLTAGECSGVFQLESPNMISFIKQLKPESIEDIIAGIALYRPGPMDFIPKYIEGKNNKNNIKYDHEKLKPILKNTYGCIIYQEQVMQIVMDLAGFSMSKSDEFRRAMGKKKHHIMEKGRRDFIYGNKNENIPGCVANGIDEDLANNIYDKMVDFAKYAFNKAHATSYAYITYQTAYLKCYYKEEFMASILTSVSDKIEKIAEYIYDCEQMNIKVLSPCINKSEANFSIDYEKKEKCIRYGLMAIKSIGECLIKEIIDIKKTCPNNKFLGLEDFIKKTHKILKKNSMENLIKAGALDFTGISRKAMIESYEEILNNYNSKKNIKISGQQTLNLLVNNTNITNSSNIENNEEYEYEEKLKYEKEVLGIYLSEHPLNKYKKLLKKKITHISSDFKNNDKDNRLKNYQKVTIAGIVKDYKSHITKSGNNMAFFKIEDLIGEINIILFQNVYKLYSDIVKNDEKLFIEGIVKLDDQKDAYVVANNIYKFSDKIKNIYIKFKNKEEFNRVRDQINERIKDNIGKDKIIVYFSEEKQYKILKKVTFNNRLKVYFERLVGKQDNIKITEKNVI